MTPLVSFDAPLELPPSFVLSCERSGSTLLRYLIDTHPEIASPGELALGHLLFALTRTLERSVVLLEPGGMEKQRATRLEARRVVDGILSSYARARGKRAWCEKSPSNWQHLELLYSVFPDARWLCLHRHCLDVVSSVLEVSRLGFHPAFTAYVAQCPDNLVEALARAWVEKTRAILQFEREHRSRCLRIGYERLVREPRQLASEIFAFLGVADAPDVVERVFSTPHDDGGGDPKIRFATRIEQSSVGKGALLPITQLSQPTLSAVNATLLELGYAAIGIAPGASSAAEAEAPSAEIAAIFEQHVPRKLDQNVEQARALDSDLTFRFVVEGPGGGIWRVRPAASGEERVVRGPGPAHCVISLPGEILIAIARGELNGVTAFMERKLNVLGDPGLALKIGLFL